MQPNSIIPNRFITLQEIAKSAMIDFGETNPALYNRYMSWLIRGVNELNFDVLQRFKQTVLAVDQNTFSAKLPDDYVQYVRIGLVNTNNEFIPFTLNDGLIGGFVEPDCHCNECGCSNPVCKALSDVVTTNTNVSLIQESKSCVYQNLFKYLQATTVCSSVAYPLTINTIAINGGTPIVVNQVANTSSELLAIVFAYTGDLALQYTLNFTVASVTHTCTWTRTYVRAYPFQVISYTKNGVTVPQSDTITGSADLNAYMASIGWNPVASLYQTNPVADVWNKFTITAASPFVNGLNYVQYDLTAAVFPSPNCTMYIDSIAYNLGVIDTVAQLVAALNALNLGLFSYNTTTHILTIIGTHNYTTPNGLVVGLTPFFSGTALGITDINSYPISCSVLETPVTKTNTKQTLLNPNGDIIETDCLWGYAHITPNANYYIDLSAFNSATYPITDGILIKNGVGINLPSISTVGALQNYLVSLGFASATPAVPTLYIQGSTDVYTSLSSLGQNIDSAFTSDAPQTQGTLENNCHTRTICTVEVKPCGCATIDEATVNVLIAGTGQDNAAWMRWYKQGSFYQPLAVPGNAFGYYNVDRDAGIVYFNHGLAYQSVYIQYYSANNVDTQNFLVPVQSQETLVGWINYKSVMYRKNVSADTKRDALRIWTNEKNKLRERLDPMILSEVLDVLRNLPIRP